MKIAHALLATAAWAASSIAMAQGDPPAQPPAGGAPGGDMMAAINATFKACDAELKATCGGTPGPQALQCLVTHKDAASAACKQALASLPPPPAGGPPGGGPPGGGAPPASAAPPK